MFRQLLTQNRRVLGITSGFEYRATQATTSGTEFDFSDITPSAKRITLAVNGCSLSVTDEMIVQIGGSGGLETSGYAGATSDAAAATTWSSGALLQATGTAATLYYGACVLTLYDPSTNTWVATVNVGTSTNNANVGGGRKALTATLDRVRLTRNGTDTFDAGSVGLLIET